MADETEELTLTILRNIQREMSDMRADLRERLDSIDTRLLALETQVTSLHQTNGEFRYRFDRIERRLDLVDIDER